jgi:putative endonuclease
VISHSARAIGEAGRPTVARMTVARQRLGQSAENAVASELEAGGWRILARNPRTRFGELDLVGLDGDTLVFVEVKGSRSGPSSGPVRPVLAVGPAKQRRIRTLARSWIAEQRRVPSHRLIRFDAVGVLFDRGGNLLGIEHIRNAF